MKKNKLKNKLVQMMIAIVSSFLCIWLLTGFVLWNWSPSEWSEGARFFTALIGIAFALPIIGIFESNNYDE